MDERKHTSIRLGQECEEETAPGLELPTLEALLMRIAKQDRDAFRILFRRSARRIVSIGYTVLRDQKEAEGLVQHVFQVIWQRAHLFDPSIVPAKDWITRLTYHCAFTRRRNLILVDHQKLCGHKIAPQAESVLSESDEQLRRVLCGRSNVGELFQQLSEKQQQILRLNYYGGRNYREISDALGIPIEDVITEHIAAIEVLRKGYKDRGRE